MDTLINGSRPSFVSLTVTLAGKDQPRGAFRSISYGVQQEPGLIYSKSQAQIVGTTPGSCNATGSFEMLVTEFNAFAEDMTDKGSTAITDVTFDIQVAYTASADGIDVQTDRILGCKISALNASNQGTDAITRSVNFTFVQLVTNGVVVGGNTSAAVRDASGELLLQPVASDFWWATYEDDNGEWFSPGFTGNTYSKEPWDYVWLAIPYSGSEQPQTPGICEVQVTKERSVDKKKAAGGDGTRNTIHGINSAEGEIHITIWTPQQYRVLMELWPLLFPGPQKFTTTKTVVVSQTTRSEFHATADSTNGVTSSQTLTIPQKPQTKRVSTTQVKSVIRSFDVQHPKLKLHKVNSVVFTGATGPEPGPTPLSRIFTMKWVEFLPQNAAINSTVTPVASKASTYEPTGYQTPGSNPANRGP